MRRIHKYKRDLKDRQKLRTRLNNNHFYFTNILFNTLTKKGLKQKIFIILCRAVYNIKLGRHIKGISYISTLDLFKTIFLRLYSRIFLKTQHVGKTKYIIPLVAVRSSISLAIRWFFKALNARPERTLLLRLTAALNDVLNGTSSSIEEKNIYYRTAFKSKTNFKVLRFLKK